MEKLTTKRPNIKDHIAIYCGASIEPTTLEHVCIKELLELAGSFDFAMRFTYAIYANHSMVKDNMMIPIFHSYYLNSDPKMVILIDHNPIDILELYPYHNFYVYEDPERYYEDTERYNLLKTQFPNHSIKLIHSIKEII